MNRAMVQIEKLSNGYSTQYPVYINKLKEDAFQVVIGSDEFKSYIGDDIEKIEQNLGEILKEIVDNNKKYKYIRHIKE